jgi:hypothetical protein
VDRSARSARDVLEELVRKTMRSDLDALIRHMEEELAAVRREVVVLRRLAGLPSGPLGREERRVRAVELRSSGLSLRAIAAELGCDRSTAAADLRCAGVERPARIVGLDGRRTRGPSTSSSA